MQFSISNTTNHSGDPKKSGPQLKPSTEPESYTHDGKTEISPDKRENKPIPWKYRVAKKRAGDASSKRPYTRSLSSDVFTVADTRKIFEAMGHSQTPLNESLKDLHKSDTDIKVANNFGKSLANAKEKQNISGPYQRPLTANIKTLYKSESDIKSGAMKCEVVDPSYTFETHKISLSNESIFGDIREKTYAITKKTSLKDIRKDIEMPILPVPNRRPTFLKLRYVTPDCTPRKLPKNSFQFQENIKTSALKIPFQKSSSLDKSKIPSVARAHEAFSQHSRANSSENVSATLQKPVWGKTNSRSRRPVRAVYTITNRSQSASGRLSAPSPPDQTACSYASSVKVETKIFQKPMTASVMAETPDKAAEVGECELSCSYLEDNLTSDPFSSKGAERRRSLAACKKIGQWFSVQEERFEPPALPKTNFLAKRPQLLETRTQSFSGFPSTASAC